MSATAVVVVDMLNPFRHHDAEKPIPSVEEIIAPLADLIDRARHHDDIDVIYVNDNYGDFTADFSGIVGSALDGQRPDLVRPIVPVDGNLLVLKVRGGLSRRVLVSNR